MKKFFVGLALGILITVSAVVGAIGDRLLGFSFLNKYLPEAGSIASKGVVDQRILREESVVTSVVKEVGPSVITVSITKQQQEVSPFFFDPFGVFGFQQPRGSEPVQQDIGSGFVIDKGLVVTNKHVVADTQATYQIITKDEKKLDVKKIYRDPTNDIAILKVDGLEDKPAAMGDSDKLEVGQFVIAIGTALGEFPNTVTTGVISGLGRGIQAGDPFGTSAEQLDNVIQTDAAINPGNSGGPLLNSAGQIIGVNVAVAQGSQNIGFALPINTVKKVIDSFKITGSFERPFLGVRYQMISKETALMNDVPAGAYVADVVSGSPAEKAGIQKGDIIVKLDNQKVTDLKGGLAEFINSRKVGDKIDTELFRDGKTLNIKVALTSQ